MSTMMACRKVRVVSLIILAAAMLTAATNGPPAAAGSVDLKLRLATKKKVDDAGFGWMGALQDKHIPAFESAEAPFLPVACIGRVVGAKVVAPLFTIGAHGIKLLCDACRLEISMHYPNSFYLRLAF